MTGIESILAPIAIKSAAGPATKALSAWGKAKYDKFVATYTECFSPFVEESVRQCSIVRNILYRKQTAKTDDKYVNVRFGGDQTYVSDKTLIDGLLAGQHIMIRGRGGAGKTMFTKWAVLRIFESIANHQKIPIFIELRDLRVEKNIDLFEDYLFDRITNSRTKTTRNQFIEGLKAGIFVFILDAADEIKKDRRNEILKKINDFEGHYPESGILLTTRDFTEIDGISGFDSYSTLPLEEDQYLSIIEKLDYRDDIKESLIKDVKDGRFENHSFFLENPLLVTILLLTYDQSREIPTKRSAFFRRAFETLFERHDGSKDGPFSRDHHAGLPMEDFEAVFSLFCYGTYINSIYDFEIDELRRFLASAAKQCGVKASGADLARDAIESVCLLVQEGHEILFVHRSFQEYFATLYIKNYKNKDIGLVIEEAIKNGQGENTLEFLCELDQESLEKHYILPNLKKLNRSFKRYNLEEDGEVIRCVRGMISSFKISQDKKLLQRVLYAESFDSQFLLSISSAYDEADFIKIFVSSEDDNYAIDFFGDLPMDDVAKSRSSKAIGDHNGDPILEVKFSPSSIDWVKDTGLIESVKSFIFGLRDLEKRLESRHAKDHSLVRSRFETFSRS